MALSETETFTKYETSNFRVRGSRWEEDVSNSTGWTIDTMFVIPAEIDGEYQSIRINDGSKFAEVRLYNDKISLKN